MRRLLTACFVMLVAALPAAAQDYKPVDFNIGFGATFPTQASRPISTLGWNGTIGVTFNLNAHLGLQGDTSYTRMNGPDKTISIAQNPGAAAYQRTDSEQSSDARRRVQRRVPQRERRGWSTATCSAGWDSITESFS